jgi:hypothetical protein
MSDKSPAVAVNASFPVFSILLLVFVLCKVFEYGPIAQWSWFWVLSPFWIPFAIALSVFALLCVGAFIAVMLD